MPSIQPVKAGQPLGNAALTSQRYLIQADMIDSLAAI
jgi:hypothetical protein